MKQKRPYLIGILILIGFLLLFFTNREESLIRIDDPKLLNEGWSYQFETISLPTKVDATKDVKWSIHTQLNESFQTNQVLLIRSSLQDIFVYLDDELLYEETYGDSLLKPYASMWHFIEIPANSNDRVLRLEFNTPYQGMAGQLNDIVYGETSQLYAHLFRVYGLRLIIGLLIFIIGMVVLVSNYFVSKTNDKGFAYPALFAICVSLWILAESRLLQFFTGSELLIGSLAYLVLPLVPLPLIDYLKDYVLGQFKTILTSIRWLYLGHFAFILLSNLIGWMDFFQTVFLTQIWLVLGIVISFILLYLDHKLDRKNQAKWITHTYIVIVVFAFFEFLAFLLGDFRNNSIFISFGLAVLMITLFINYIRYLVQRVKSSHQKDMYEKLAFYDYLTDGQNRLSFERDIDSIFMNPDRLNTIRLIVFDLDDLKRINDVYGHLVGDEAIKKAFLIIQQTFNDFGKCYRIGGDEFACIYENRSEELYLEKCSQLNDAINSFEHDTPYHFGLSIGSAVVENELASALELYELADQDLYRFKTSRKVPLQRL